MQMYILRWNPNFSMKYEHHLEGLKMIKNGPVSTDWSVYDHEELECGDLFIQNQVGCKDEDGIAGFGVFISDPYSEKSWKAGETINRFYSEIKFDCLLDRRGGNIFSASEMENLFPQINWHTGHSGVLVPKEIEEDLILYLMQKTLFLKKPTKKISFSKNHSTYPLKNTFVYFINKCCPKFKQKIAENGVRCVNYKKGEVIDKSLIDVSYNLFNKDVELTENSTLEDYAKFFVAEV